MTKTIPPNYREIDGQEAAALVKQAAPKFAAAVDLSRREYSDGGAGKRWTVRLYQGATTRAADFFVERGIVLVHGDLIVDGHLFDCWSADHTLLVVLGDLSASSAMLAGETLVTGDLSCRDLLYTDSMNDYALTVGGTLRARALVNAGTHCEVSSALEVERLLVLSNTIVSGPGKTHSARTPLAAAAALSAGTFVAECLDRNGLPDEEELRDALKDDRPVLQDPFAPVADSPKAQQPPARSPRANEKPKRGAGTAKDTRKKAAPKPAKASPSARKKKATASKAQQRTGSKNAGGKKGKPRSK